MLYVSLNLNQAAVTVLTNVHGISIVAFSCLSWNITTHNTKYEKSKIPFSYMLYAYSVKDPIGELNLKRALDEDTGVFSSFFSLLSSSSPLGQTAVSGNSTLHQ